ncbi:MAG: 50S ribosomal protein L18 [Desulfobacteraceae bacterium]|nr:50S ribosomal protein L18 [Desulfobacteraceae bacterium]
MSSTNPRELARLKRKARIRKKIKGTSTKPRLSVFRSTRNVYAQIIDDIAGATIVSASTLDGEIKGQQKFDSKCAAAVYVGKIVAQRAMAKGIKQVVFDRNGFLYHGRVKALTDGAREAGLNF